MITATVKAEETIRRLTRLAAGMTPARVDRVIDREALKTLARVVQATPKKWFGQVRRSWQIVKPKLGARIVRNDNKVMRFLEDGTADNGTGWIYPVIKKFLYIPLTRAAALSGWHEGMVWGEDYILRPRVRGIVGRHIAAAEQERTNASLLAAMKEHVRGLMR